TTSRRSLQVDTCSDPTAGPKQLRRPLDRSDTRLQRRKVFFDSVFDARLSPETVTFINVQKLSAGRSSVLRPTSAFSSVAFARRAAELKNPKWIQGKASKVPSVAWNEMAYNSIPAERATSIGAAADLSRNTRRIFHHKEPRRPNAMA